MLDKIGVTELYKFYSILCLIVGASKIMCRVLTSNLLLKKTFNMFECMDIVEYVYESVVEPSYKKILGHMPPVLVTARKK